MKSIELRKINPYHAIDRDTGLILNQNGDVTKLFRLKLPSLFTQGYEDLSHFSVELSTRFKTLPANSLVNVIGLYFKENYESDFNNATSYTSASDLKYWHLKEVLTAELYLSVTLSERKAKPFNGTAQSSLFSTRDFLFSNKPFKSVKLIDKYQQIFKSFHGQMSSFEGVDTEEVKAEETLQLLYKFWTFNFHEGGDTFDQYAVPDILLGKNDFMVGDKTFKVISLVKEGSDISGGINNPGLTGDRVNGFGTMNKIKLPVSYTYPISMGLPFDHITCVSIEIIDNDVAASVLDSRGFPLKMVRLFSPFAKVKLDAYEEFKSLLFEEDLQAVNVGVNIILADSNDTVLEDQVNYVKSAFTKMAGSMPFVESLEAFPAFMYSLPGNRKDWERNHLSVMELATCYVPKEMPHKEDLEGYYFLDRSGKPVLVNFWYSDLVANVNQVIIGPSGSGKSFTMNGLIHKMNNLDYQVVIIDVGHSYKETCRQINGGKDNNINGYFDSDDKETLGINVFKFSATGTEKEVTTALTDKKNLVYMILKIIWKGGKDISQEESQVLKNLIGKFYADVSNPKNAKGFLQFLEGVDQELKKDDPIRRFFDFEAFKIVFRPFVDGDYEWVFRDNDTSIEDYDMVVFSLKSIEGDSLLYPIYTIIIVELILSKIRRLPISVRKSFIIDEAWAIFKGELASFVEYLYRTIRKENGQVSVITQNANDILTSGIADAIKINTDIKIVLKHNNLDEETQRIFRNSLGFTTTDIELLGSLENSEKGREFFVKFGSHPYVFINENSPESRLVYTTNPDELGTLKKLTELTGDMQSAINEFVDIKSKIKN